HTSGPTVARVIGWVWVSTWFVVSEFRKSMADPYLAFFALAAVVAWVRSAKPRLSHDRGAARWIVLFWVAVALGGMSKGPVILLHVGIACAALAFTHRLRPRGPMLTHAVGLGLFLVLTLSWPIYVLRTLPGALEIWRYESIGEFADNQRNPRAWWMYLPLTLQLTLPWIAFWAVGLLRAIDSRDRRRWFAPLWIALTVLVFSFAHNKKAAYLLPMTPAVILLAAQGVGAVMAMLRRPRARLAGALSWLRVSGAAVAAVAGCVVAVLVFIRPGVVLPLTSSPTVELGARLLLASAAIITGLLPCRRAAIEHRRWFRYQAAAIAALIVLILVFPSAHDASRRPRRALDPAERTSGTIRPRAPAWGRAS
ncbi:MAG: hypothetical protein ABIP55_03810, partial [Tepidisphaeraceae bacterium]